MGSDRRAELRQAAEQWAAVLLVARGEQHATGGEQPERLARLEPHRAIEVVGVVDPHALVLDGHLDHRVGRVRRNADVVDDAGEVADEVVVGIGEPCRDLVEWAPPWPATHGMIANRRVRRSVAEKRPLMPATIVQASSR